MDDVASHTCACSGSAESETEAAWVMGVTWAVADALLAAAPTWCTRRALLERLTSLDLPVPSGSGVRRYGCRPVHHLRKSITKRSAALCASHPGLLAGPGPLSIPASGVLAGPSREYVVREGAVLCSATQGQSSTDGMLCLSTDVLGNWRLWNEGAPRC